MSSSVRLSADRAGGRRLAATSSEPFEGWITDAFTVSICHLWAAATFSAAPSPPTSFEIEFHNSLFTKNQGIIWAGRSGTPPPPTKMPTGGLGGIPSGTRPQQKQQKINTQPEFLLFGQKKNLLDVLPKISIFYIWKPFSPIVTTYLAIFIYLSNKHLEIAMPFFLLHTPRSW